MYADFTTAHSKTSWGVLDYVVIFCREKKIAIINTIESQHKLNRNQVTRSNWNQNIVSALLLTRP